MPTSVQSREEIEDIASNNQDLLFPTKERCRRIKHIVVSQRAIDQLRGQRLSHRRPQFSHVRLPEVSERGGPEGPHCSRIIQGSAQAGPLAEIGSLVSAHTVFLWEHAVAPRSKVKTSFAAVRQRVRLGNGWRRWLR